MLRDRVIVDEREYQVLRGRRGWRAIVDPRGPAGRVRYDGLRDRISIDSVHGVLEIRFRWRHTTFAWRGRMYRVGSMAWNRFTIWDGDRPALEGKIDRKSTRLNSSHLVISYAVFCLKKKKKNCLSLLCVMRSLLVFFFFFNDTATTEIYTLSLHDALPIYRLGSRRPGNPIPLATHDVRVARPDVPSRLDGLEPLHHLGRRPSGPGRQDRSEEHTSELQSPCNLVCRLLLEKKKKKLPESSLRYAFVVSLLFFF